VERQAESSNLGAHRRKFNGTSESIPSLAEVTIILPRLAGMGVGGIGREPERNCIARKLTWIGIGPHKTGDPRRPLVTFDQFLYYGEKGPLLETLAPALASHMYGGNVRAMILDSSSPAKERLQAEKILDTARNAPPSPARKMSRHTSGTCA